MRPLLGSMPFRRDRGRGDADVETDAVLVTPTPPPMACFITTEAGLDVANSASFDLQSHRTTCHRKRSFNDGSDHSPRSQSRVSSPAPTTASLASFSSSALDLDLEPGTPQHHSPSIPPICANLSSVSASSSTSSRRGSVSASSNFSGDVSQPPDPGLDGWTGCNEDSQFIMPSLPVPQRRPFSIPGKSVGNLKILVAGPPGNGKTTIVSAISQCCEHIVHMDPIVRSSTGKMSEVHASTRPKLWWQPHRYAGVPARRQSGSEVLDRNLRFVVRSVDYHTPSMEAELSYLDSELQSVLEKPLGDSDLWDLLVHGSQPNVDLVLFMTSRTGLNQRDIDFIKSIQQKTNVILLLARSDEMSQTEMVECKERLRRQAFANNLECFTFSGMETSSSESSIEIYAVSSLSKTDHDTLDATTLMDPAYVQPLSSTELATLMEKVCSEEGSILLRQSMARKCIAWRKSHRCDFPSFATNTALTHRDPAKCALSSVLTMNPFRMRRSWHRVELSDWAGSLRRSLDAALSDSNARRAQEVDIIQQWVSMKLSQGRNGQKAEPRYSGQNRVHQDPLGVLELAGLFKRNGRVVLELLSVPGIAGCLAIFMSKPTSASSRGLMSLLDITGWLC